MEKKWALITGASSGIGYAYAEALAARKYNLIIVSNELRSIQEKGLALKNKFGIEVIPLYADLAVPDAAKELYSTCQKLGLEIEILINNAGMFYFNTFTETNPATSEKMLYLHVHTPTQLCHYFGREMKKRRQGYILNMSSLSAWMPYPGIGLYASTKRYLKNFSRALRAELSDYHVSVTVVCPGAVCTNLYNLSDRLKKLATRLGIMMLPEKLAEKGIQAMFKRKGMLIPGLINKIALPLIRIIPVNVIYWGLKKGKLLNEQD